MNRAVRKVLVSHPGRQHSHQAALALERADLLAAYWAGVPATEPKQRRTPAWFQGPLRRYAPVDLPHERTRWIPVAVALRRVARSTPRRVEQVIDLAACRLFDRQVARGLMRLSAGAVLACEISALETFRTAKRLGMVAVLDAPSFHHAVQDRVTPVPEAEWLHRKIVRVKAAEIGLADHVITVSELARAGYVEAGVPANRVHAVPVGADTQLFHPGPGDARDPRSPCTFLFVGATIQRKGIDVLLQAFAELRRVHPGAVRLVVAGPRGDAHGRLERAEHRDVDVLPAMTQAELAALYRGADCFVLPSRHDSFGMVVVEAMACGLPAIVSDLVGAREAIEEGRNGWVTPAGDPSALAARMAWCVANRPALAAMRGAARTTAERYDWNHYRARLAQLMASILAGAC